MVASYGDLTPKQCLVRVPGSGGERVAVAKCIDLGNIQPWAARVSVDTHEPLDLRRRRCRDTETITKDLPDAKIMKLDKEGSPPSRSSQPQDLPQPRPQIQPKTTETSHPLPPQSQDLAQPRPLIQFKPNNHPLPRPSQPQYDPQHHPPPKIVLMNLDEINKCLQQKKIYTAKPIQVATPPGVSLVQTRSLIQIMLENDRLQHQVGLFQQLFKDKERLASVVSHLGLKVERQ